MPSERDTASGRVPLVEGPEMAFGSVGHDQRSFDILKSALSHPWTIAACTLLCWCLAGLYYVLAAPVYESESQLLVMQKDPTLATSGGRLGQDAQAAVTEDLLATQMQLLQSRRIVSEALAAHGLDDLESIRTKLSEDKAPEDYVIGNLDVTRGGDGQAATARVLNVAFRHSSPEEAKTILDAVIARYQAFVNETFRDVGKEAAQLIEKARTDLSEQLTSAEAAYRDYREHAPILWAGDESSNVHRQRYENLQVELSELDLEINEAAARLEVVHGVVAEQDEDGATDLERLAVIDERHAQRIGLLVAVRQGAVETPEFQASMPIRAASAQGEYASIMQLKLRERELVEEFGPQHPELIAVRNQLEEASKFIAEKTTHLGVSEGLNLDSVLLQKAYVKLLERDLESHRKRRNELVALAAQEEAEAKTLVKYELEGEVLRKTMDRQQELYDAVVDRLRDLNMATSYGGQINEVIAPAKIGKNVWPSLFVCLSLGTVAGLLLGGGVAMAQEHRDQSFKTPEDIRQALDAPLLSHVPTFEVKKDGRLAAAMDASQSQASPDVVAHHLPRSLEAEVFRGLRTSLFFRAATGDLRTFAFTSPQMGDGKTTVIVNLAVSMAQSGRSVLLVDADLRRPSVARILGLKGVDGLPKLLADGTDPWDLVMSSETENLSVLPCGAPPENPAELLTSPRFAEFLRLAQERYDYVLIDCPPILAVADPCIIAGVTDAVVLVVRIARSGRTEARHVKELLEDAGANLIGAIVNCFDDGSTRRTGGYQYRYQYTSGYSTEFPKDGVKVVESSSS